MTLHFRNGEKKVCIYIVFFQQFFQGFPACTEAAGMDDGRPGPGQRDRLVQAFSACLYSAGKDRQCFTGLNEVIHIVYVIQIEGTKVQDAHLLPLSPISLFLMINHDAPSPSSVFLDS